MISRQTLRTFITVAGVFLSVSAIANATDLVVKAPKPADAPFFEVNDNRLTYAYFFKATDPGYFSVRPDGNLNSTTPKNVYSLSHFDVWV